MNNQNIRVKCRKWLVLLPSVDHRVGITGLNIIDLNARQ